MEIYGCFSQAGVNSWELFSAVEQYMFGTLVSITTAGLNVLLSQNKLRMPMIIVMKEQVTKGNSVAHWCGFYSFLTKPGVCITDD